MLTEEAGNDCFLGFFVLSFQPLVRDKKTQWETCKMVLAILRSISFSLSTTELVYIISLIYKVAFRQFHTAFLRCRPKKHVNPRD